MITIFTIPKPFVDRHTAIIQSNAIESWKKLTPNIFLMGDDSGVKTAAKSLGVAHFPEVTRNSFGTPYLQPAFNLAAKHSPDDYLCYVNADIIFMSDFLKVLRFELPKPSFLIVGQRWDLDVDTLINFREKNWQHKVRQQIKTRGSRHAPSGSDYFLFRKDNLFNLPDFVVGRAAWDNWMIYESRRLKIPVIDAGNLITAVHQNHNYTYYKGPGADVWSGPEVKKHFEIIGGKYRRFDIGDSDHIITNKGLVKRSFSFIRLWQYLCFTPEVLSGDGKKWELARKPSRFILSLYFFIKGIFHQAQESALILPR